MRIIVTGSKGQLGTELMALLGSQDHHEVLGLDLPDVDLTDRDQVLGTITSFAPDAVIHGAAFTAVDLCEEQVETAYRVNCAATRFVADGAGRVVVELYHHAKVPVPDYPAMEPLVFHIAFVTDDVRGTLRRLLDAGATAAGEVTVTPTGDEMVFLRDPGGVPLQLVKRSAPLL